MKKQLCIGLLTFFILSCRGCKNITYTDNKPDEPIKKIHQDISSRHERDTTTSPESKHSSRTTVDKENVDDEETPSLTRNLRKRKQSNKSTDLNGLGATPASWNHHFGHPYTQGNTLKIYQEGACKVIFENDHATSITLISQDGKNPLQYDLLPDDRSLVTTKKKVIGSITMITQHWHSEKLRKSIPQTKGNFTIIHNLSGTTYTDVVINCSPGVKK